MKEISKRGVSHFSLDGVFGVVASAEDGAVVKGGPFEAVRCNDQPLNLRV